MDRRRIQSNRIFQRRYTTTPPPPTQPLPRPFTLRARPFLFMGSFVILHQTIATIAIIPVYQYFKYTDSSTALLAGPYVAKLLHIPLPFSKGERTVEDLAEAILKKSIKASWGVMQRWRGRRNQPAQDADHIAEEVIKDLEGQEHWRERLKKRIVNVKGGDTSIWDKWRSWRQRGAEQISTLSVITDIVEPKDGTLKRITDISAAYLFVKATFPLRLAVSVFLTPRFARFVGRRWR